MNEQALIEAVREFARAEESESMAARQGDAAWQRSAYEERAIALAKLKEAIAAYNILPTASRRPAAGRESTIKR